MRPLNLLLAFLPTVLAFTPVPITPAPSLRTASPTSLGMQMDEGRVSRKSFIGLGFGLLAAAALPPRQASAGVKITAEQMSESLMKQEERISNLIKGPFEGEAASIDDEYAGEPTPESDPFLDAPQSLINFEELKKGKKPILDLSKENYGQLKFIDP